MDLLHYWLEVKYLRDCQIAGKSFRAFATAFAWKHSIVHQGNDLGYGKNAKDWIICSQVLTVQTYGCSSTTKWQSVWLY